MRTGGSPEDSTVGATVGVATALEELKSRGSALLVVGSVPEEVYAKVSSCLLGGDCTADRRRLVVEGAPAPDARYESVDRWTPEWTRILQCDVVARGSTGKAGRGESLPPSGPGTAGRSRSTGPTSRLSVGRSAHPTTGENETRREATRNVEGSIAELGVDIGEAIQQFDAIAGGLEPAELRVGFDCVDTLLAEYDERTVFRFLHVLANDARAANGMAHVRLSQPFDADSTRLFAPLFDAVIELRLNGSEPEQRWHLRDADTVSEWLPVDA